MICCLSNLDFVFIFYQPLSQGIIDATQVHLPHVYHAHCVWHLEKNVNTKFRTKVNGKIWSAAKALTKSAFSNAMDDIKQINADVAAYLENILPASWALSMAPVRRFGYTTSNMAESFNSWLNEVRDAGSPLTTLDDIFRNIGALFFKRRTLYNSMRSTIPPSTAEMLQDAVDEGCRLQVRQFDEQVFDVISSYARRSVNLAESM